MSFGDTSDDTTSEHEAATTAKTKKIIKSASPGKKTSQRHKCSEPGCLATFSRPYRLKNHIESQHKGLKPYKCHIQGCNKSYTNDSHLKRHIVVTHIETKQSEEVLCPEPHCGQTFANKYSLKKHVNRAHKNLSFKCESCGEGFKHRSQLHAHKVTAHSEETPFKCEKCLEMFVHQHAYNKHVARHKVYECDCGQLFEKWSQMCKHRKEQCKLPKKSYKCAICDKTFCFKKNLALHCKLHLKESYNETFKCSYINCNRSYKYKKNLNMHVRTFHEQFVEYLKCTSPGCNMVLKSKRNLEKHLANCHGDKRLKIKKPKKSRKDKGVMRKTMISQMSGVPVSDENKLNITSKEPEVNVDNANSSGSTEELEEILRKVLPHYGKVSEEVESRPDALIVNSDVIVFERNEEFNVIVGSTIDSTIALSENDCLKEVEMLSVDTSKKDQQGCMEELLIVLENK